MGPAGLRTRPMIDPRFTDEGVGSTEVNWRDYITVSITNPVLRKDTIAALDVFASTPDGRAVLRQGFAMHQQRMGAGDAERYRAEEVESQGVASLPLSPVDGKIRIQDIVPTDQPFTDNGEARVRATSNFSGAGVLTLDFDQIYMRTYTGIDGKTHRNTIEQTLFHELGHAADTLNTFDGKEALRAANIGSDAIEAPAFLLAARYVEKEFGMVGRDPFAHAPKTDLPANALIPSRPSGPVNDAMHEHSEGDLGSFTPAPIKVLDAEATPKAR